MVDREEEKILLWMAKGQTPQRDQEDCQDHGLRLLPDGDVADEADADTNEDELDLRIHFGDGVGGVGNERFVAMTDSSFTRSFTTSFLGNSTPQTAS